VVRGPLPRVSPPPRIAYVNPAADARTRNRSGAAVPTCAGCFFRRHMLCALDRDDPCATYRPDRAEGLQPPRQMAIAFRPTRATGTPFAFPDAYEQARRYAA